MENGNGNGKSNGRCTTSEVRNGITYRCSKELGHEMRGDPECEAEGAEYGYRAPNWQALFEQARPALEWMATAHGIVPEDKQQAAKRALINAYVAMRELPRHPGVMNEKN